MQAVVTITPPPPAPPAPVITNDTPAQAQQATSNWLSQLVSWLSGIIGSLNGAKVGSSTTIMESFNFSFLSSGVFWSTVVTVLSAVFTTLAAQYPTAVWIGIVVTVLSLISVNYFHKSAVLAAAQSSATLGKVVSGQ
jgi:hypothetical protein